MLRADGRRGGLSGRDDKRVRHIERLESGLQRLILASQLNLHLRELSGKFRRLAAVLVLQLLQKTLDIFLQRLRFLHHAVLLRANLFNFILELLQLRGVAMAVR